jgi:nucleotidyltransferase substrate binding protein (TIGR01987 family)
MAEKRIITESLEKALVSLKEAWVEYQKDISNTFVRDSVIQRFEYTFDLSHKILRRFLAETEPGRDEVIELMFNDLIRLANKRGLLLNNLETWDKYRNARNLTSHTYDELNAEKIMIIIPVFIEDVETELTAINKKLSENKVLQINEKQLSYLRDILSGVSGFSGSSAFLYGSRAQGKALRYSDFDLAVDYQGSPMPETLKASILSAFEKSVFPYSVDLIDINRVSAEFRKTIEKDFVKIL